MLTTIKPKKTTPGLAVQSSQENIVPSNVENEMTVEQYLEGKCEEIIAALREHTDSLILKLRKEYELGVTATNELMNSAISHPREICVILKVTKGNHIGQKFRLETTDGDDVFKIGRSTSKYFKEKGVSLYKDKEISSTHARVEMRNGQVFLLDCRSTNGTTLNNDECEALLPYRLNEGDVVGMGNTEMSVHISETQGGTEVGDEEGEGRESFDGERE